MPENHSAQIPGHATLRGVVLYKQAAITSAIVKLTEIATGHQLESRTNDRGEFVAPIIAVGDYMIEVNVAGFLRWHEQVRIPEEGQFVEINPTMLKAVKDEEIDLSIPVSWSSMTRRRIAPLTYSLVAFPDAVVAGDPMTITGTAQNLSPVHDTEYLWTCHSDLNELPRRTSVAISNTGNVANVDTRLLQPGSYTVASYVRQGPGPEEVAIGFCDFTVLPGPDFPDSGK